MWRTMCGAGRDSDPTRSRTLHTLQGSSVACACCWHGPNRCLWLWLLASGATAVWRDAFSKSVLLDAAVHAACRWKEAHDAGKASPVLLSACHIRALDYVDLDVLKQHAVQEDEQAADKNEL